MCITKKQYPPTQDAGDDESMSDSVVTKDHKHTTRHIVSSSKRRSRGKHALPRFTRTFVDHRYRDHAHDPRICSDATVHTVARGGVTMAFPEKLCQMLTAAPNDGYENIISWQPHGRCFLIHDKEVFVRTIMPK